MFVVRFDPTWPSGRLIIINCCSTSHHHSWKRFSRWYFFFIFEFWFVNQHLFMFVFMYNIILYKCTQKQQQIKNFDFYLLCVWRWEGNFCFFYYANIVIPKRIIYIYIDIWLDRDRQIPLTYHNSQADYRILSAHDY